MPHSRARGAPTPAHYLHCLHSVRGTWTLHSILYLLTFLCMGHIAYYLFIQSPECIGRYRTRYIYISIRMCECVPVSTELRQTGRLLASTGILPGAGIWTILSPDSASSSSSSRLIHIIRQKSRWNFKADLGHGICCLVPDYPEYAANSSRRQPWRFGIIKSWCCQNWFSSGVKQ